MPSFQGQHGRHQQMCGLLGLLGSLPPCPAGPQHGAPATGAHPGSGSALREWVPSVPEVQSCVTSCCLGATQRLSCFLFCLFFVKTETSVCDDELSNSKTNGQDPSTL